MPLDNTYRNYQLTADKLIPEDFKSYLLTKDVEVCNAFHRILIIGWPHGPYKLINYYEFNTDANVILVKYGYDNQGFFFHTNSIKLLQSLTNQGLFINVNKTIYNIEIIAFCATSLEMIGYEKMDDLIENVLRKRHREFELYDLSNMENEEEFTERQILFWSILKIVPYKHIFENSLCQVTVLNLSNNSLSHISAILMNVLRWKLKSLNLSNNELQSLPKLYILKELPLEELWLDGNPLCEEFRSPISYIKAVKAMFPRLIFLDGVPICNNDFGIPLLKNYLVTPNAERLIEKFISFYFPTYDSSNRDLLLRAYHHSALLTITTSGVGVQKETHSVFSKHARNLLSTKPMDEAKKIVVGSANILNVLKEFAEIEHDLSTFEIDVLNHVPNWQTTFSINGVYKETVTSSEIVKNKTKHYFFRRCFILVPTGNYQYGIINDMFFIRPAEVHELDRKIKRPASKLNELALIAPDQDEMTTMVDIFVKLSNLKPDIARRRLTSYNWDLREALVAFLDDYKNKLVPMTYFKGEDLSDEEDLDN